MRPIAHNAVHKAGRLSVINRWLSSSIVDSTWPGMPWQNFSIRRPVTQGKLVMWALPNSLWRCLVIRMIGFVIINLCAKFEVPIFNRYDDQGQFLREHAPQSEVWPPKCKFCKWTHGKLQIWTYNGQNFSGAQPPSETSDPHVEVLEPPMVTTWKNAECIKWDDIGGHGLLQISFLFTTLVFTWRSRAC